MKIALFNDTSNVPHIGCQAVSQAHDKHLKKHEVLYRTPVSTFLNISSLDEESQISELKRNQSVMQQLDNVEAIVINGEGTLHHDRGSEYLALAKIAKEKGLKVYLLNTLFQEMTKHIDVLNDLDDITVREKFSFDYMTSLGVKNHRMVLDSILDADFVPVGTYDFQNKLVFTDFHHQRHDVGEAMRQVFLHVGRSYEGRTPDVYPLQYDTAKKDWKNALQNFRTANMIITGRHHGVYLAGLAGVPFVACPGNSWKVESLIKTSKLPIPVCTTPEEIYHGYNFALEQPEIFQKFTQFLYRAKEKGLGTFDKLNKDSINEETSTINP